jgi:hypothetical protein
MAKSEQSRELGSFFGPQPKAESQEKSTTPSPEKAEAKPEALPEPEAKAEEKSPAKEKPQEEAKAESKPAEAKEEKTEETKEAVPKDPWDSPENPYKKRYEDTRQWARGVESVNKQLQQLAHKTDVVEKKLDGTYDPEKDAIRLTPTQEESEFMGRFNASLELAVEEHGEESINAKITEFNERFGANPIVQARVRMAKNPIQEGLKVLEEAGWAQKWGGDKATPKSIEDNIRADEAAKWKAQIQTEVQKAIKERFDKVSEKPQTLSEVKGSANQDKPAYQPKTIGNFFHS